MGVHLRPEAARKLADAEDAYTQAKDALEKADKERRKWRARCRPLLPTGEAVLVGGISIRVTPTSTGPVFRLVEYLKKHKVTKSMEPFVTEAKEYDRWTVKRIAA